MRKNFHQGNLSSIGRYMSVGFAGEKQIIFAKYANDLKAHKQ